jgi:type IV pilus assembly protein PilN
MNITINLATRPFADLGPALKRLRIAMAVFALLSIGLGFGLHRLHAKADAARARESALDSQIVKVNQQRQGYEAMMRQPENALVLQQAHNLNALFDQKAFSWTLAMEDLETVLPGGVQVTTLEPIRDDKTGTITLKLRVVGARDKAVELVENLEHSHHFLRPAIVGESTESSGGPNQPLEPVSMSNKVNVDLTAEYNPATLDELPSGKKKSQDSTPSGDAAAVSDSPPPPASKRSGPGLRRPPLAGVSRPPAVGLQSAQPTADAQRKPLAGQPAAPAWQSPQAMRQAGQRRPRQAGPGGRQ